MESRGQSHHQLSNGLYVSGPPKQPKERLRTMSSAAAPYTGGDVTKSGELGRRFLPINGSRKSGPINAATTRANSFGGSASRSGSFNRNASTRSNYYSSAPLSKHGEPIIKSSGSQPVVLMRQNSVPIPPVLPATGLITSGPVSSSAPPRRISGSLDSSVHGSSRNNNPGVTTLGQDAKYFVTNNIPRPCLYALVILLVMGLIAGIFIFEAMHNSVLIILIFIVICIVGCFCMWNSCWGSKAAVGYIKSYPDSELRTAQNGQYVKISGVVTCGDVSLKSSFQRITGCVYTSTSLYEYRTWDSKAANTSYRRLTWGLRATEKHAVDFYISDNQSGLRALVKTGYSARVIPYVDEKVVIDVDTHKGDSNPDLILWMGARNLSFDDRVMQLKEGYIREGNAVTVMGVVQRDETGITIVAPPEPITIGCQWTKCIFPARLKGVVLSCDDSSKADVIV